MISASGAMLRMTPLMVPMKWSLVPKSVVNVTIGRFDKSLSVKTEISQYRENSVAERKSQDTGVIGSLLGGTGSPGLGCGCVEVRPNRVRWKASVTRTASGTST